MPQLPTDQQRTNIALFAVFVTFLQTLGLAMLLTSSGCSPLIVAGTVLVVTPVLWAAWIFVLIRY